MLDVLTSTRYVLNQAENVKISAKAIDFFVSGVNKDDLPTGDVLLTKKRWPLESLIQIIFVFNTINFCFWAGRREKKWTVRIDGKERDSSAALFRCLEKEVGSNSNFLKGKNLANLSSPRLKKILAGNTRIPLFEERLKHLNEAGRILEKNFGGSFLNVHKKAGNDAFALTKILVAYFPCFDDTSEYKGREVGFYKRAQLNSKMINDALISKGKQGLKNLEKLTAFADYKIPQILRGFGILKYSSGLADKIESYLPIEKDSKEEIEIRAATVWAVELIKQKLQEKYEFVTAPHIDTMLWNKSQIKKKEDKPYHRTLTTAY